MEKRSGRSKKRRSYSQKRIRTLDILIIVLVIALVFVVVFGSIRDRRLLKENMASCGEEKEEIGIKNQNNITSPYNKIKEGKNLNILVLGDGIGLSEGIKDTNNNWTTDLSRYLKEEYKVNSNITNLSEKEENSKIALEKLEKNKGNYDLAYVFLGQEDKDSLKPGEFQSNYKEIIKILKERNSKVDIVPVIENSLRNKNEYTNIIEEISKDDNLKVLDMATVFTKDPKPYKELTSDNIYPNDLGYELYTNNIKSLLEENLKEI